MSDDIVARLREMCGNELWGEAADEIERLRNRLLAEENSYDILRIENEHIQTDRNNLALEVERLRAERDEARKERDKATRLLHVMVEHLYGITPLDKNPKHDCGFDHRPDLGSCKFCENWTAANVILYGEEYAND